MAITIPNQWPGAFGDQDCEIVANPTAGRMLVAPIVSRVIDGSAPTLAIGDVSRNGWTLVADPIRFATSAHAAAQLQVEIWACSSVQYAGWPFELVYASAMQITAPDVGSVCVNVLEVAGMAGQLTVDSVTLATASASTTLALTAPTPAGSANCLFVAAAVADIAYGSYSTSGTGWTQLNNLVNANPNVGLMHAWREATTGGTCTFTLTLAQNWAGVVVALRTAGTTPAQPNPAWPATSFQLGLGYDLSTPLSRVRWTDQTTRYLSVDSDRGIQAELGTAQQGNTTLVIRNDDGAFTPRTVALAASATASGTATTVKVADASATNINVTDFFRLKTSAGVLKQLDVFQVVSLSSAAGTTTITFKRADGAAGGALASTASGDIYAGIQVDLYIPWRLQKTVAGTTYTVASGWLRDLPVNFTDAHWSTVAAAGADAVETLSAANPSALQGEIYRRPGLVNYWPLNDSTNAGYAANASGTSNTPLTQTVSKFGAGSQTTADFGASTQDVSALSSDANFRTSLLGDPGSGWAQDGITSAEINANKGYCLVGQDPAFPSITNGVTIAGVLLQTDTQGAVVGSSTTNPTIFILRNGDPGAGISAGSIIKLSFDRTAKSAIITVWDKDTHVATSTSVGGVAVATLNWTCWAVTFNRTTWAVYVNGFLQGSGSCDLVTNFSGIEVGGEASSWFHGRAFSGTHAHVAMYNRRLTAGEISNLGWVAANGWLPSPADLLPGRTQRKLNSVNWKGTRIISPDGGFLAPEAAPAGSINDIESELAGYQDGLWFADAASQGQMRSRIRTHHQSPRATLGDGPGEIPYQPGQTYSFDPTYIYNDVEVENTNIGHYSTTLNASTIVAVDDTSAARYGARTLQRSVRVANTYTAYHLTWWLLGRYAYPRMRVPSVIVSATASNDTASTTGRWAFVCGVEVGDLVTVNRRPIGQPMISVRCRIMQVSPSFTHGDTTTAQVTLTLAAAPPQVAVAGSPTLGVLGGTVLGA